MVPDDPSFQEHKGDPFHYGRKKSKEEGAGQTTPEYIKQRSKSYREHGLGSPLSIGLQSPNKDDLKPDSYKTLVPKATKKGTVYVAVSKSKNPQVKPIKHKRGFNDLVSALNYVNNVVGSRIDQSMYKAQGDNLQFETSAAGQKVSVSISYSARRKSMTKYLVKIKKLAD